MTSASEPKEGSKIPSGVLLTLAYDGALFSGFARQANARTIQGEVEGALREIDPKASLVRGASRTDAGVHAKGQRIAFDSELDLPSKKWVSGLNHHLPAELAAVHAARVEPGYDPRAHALSKRYRYVLLETPVPDPFLRGRAWQLGYRLNQQLLGEELELLLGRHDFAAFRSSADRREHTVREIVRTEVRTDRSDRVRIEIEIQGDRFLHNMVRIIVGTLVDVARGKLAPRAIARAFESLSRNDLGVTAPAEGLYLDFIELDDEGRDAWPA